MFTPLSWHGRPCTPSKSPLSDHMALRCAHSEAMNASPASSTASTAVSRLLDAVEVLCAEMSPSDATMRKIAAEAGLSVGLAYRYFESRDELFGAAMDRMAERIAAAAVGDDPITVVSALWKAVGDNPAFPRLVTSLILSGQNVSEVMSKHPLMRDIARSAAEQGVGDPATVAGVTGIMTLAGVLFAPTLNRTIQRDPDDPRVYDAAAEMMALWVEDARAGVSRE